MTKIKDGYPIARPKPSLSIVEAIATETERLLKQIKSSKYKSTGEPTAYLYDPPWTMPFLRRNEVIVSVEKK